MKGNLYTNNVHLHVKSKCTEGGNYPVAACILCFALSVMLSLVLGGWWRAPCIGHGNCICVCVSWLVLPVPLYELKEG